MLLFLINSFLFHLSRFAEHACRDFRCHAKEFCIHPDLLCDGVNHCSDASDESTAANCQSKNFFISDFSFCKKLGMTGSCEKWKFIFKSCGCWI